MTLKASFVESFSRTMYVFCSELRRKRENTCPASNYVDFVFDFRNMQYHRQAVLSRISLRKARLLFLVLAEWMNREPWKYMAHESTYACFTFDFQNIQYDPKVCPCKIVPWKAYCTLFLLRCAHSLTTHVLHWNYVNFIFDLPSIQHDPRIITFENDSAKSLHFVYRVLRCTESVKIHVLDKQLRRNFARNVQHSI